MLTRQHAATPRQFKNDDFQFGFESALGATYHGAADAGEVLATVARVNDGDADAWVREWTATAGAVWAAARDAEAAGHAVSALAGYRRAETYYSTALSAITHSAEAERHDELWRRQRDCWEKAVDLSPVPGERIAIPYEDTTLAGWFFRAPDAAPGEPRPTVVVNNGSDGASGHMRMYGGVAAEQRGWHWMTFDGPGQQSALFEREIPFRPDWEAVLTPVADALLARPDVDAAQLLVLGVSQAGYWVTRALAFEHRFAAAAVDPGVTDVSTSWTDHLPGPLRKQLEGGEQERFDRNMHLGELFSGSTRAMLAYRGRPYGVTGDSHYRLFSTVRQYRLGAEVDQIDTPLLITDPEGEQFWPGQSQELHDLLSGERKLVHFAAADGGGRHCEPLAGAQRDAAIFDWFEERLAASGAGTQAGAVTAG